MNFITLLLGLLAFAAFAQEITPTIRIQQSLDFSDDLDFEHLEQAVERQLAFYARSPLKGDIRFGTKIYPKTVLKDSLVLMMDLSKKYKECLKEQSAVQCQSDLNRSLNELFAVYAPVPGKNEPGFSQPATTKFTSYYSPDFNGSRQKTERFSRAIYRKPQRSEDQNHARVDIDYYGALSGKDLEVFWVEESFFDLYLLHVQGGGRIKVHNLDGSSEIKYLSYDGKNSLKFQMIYKYMLEKGYLKAGEAGVPNQRKFLQENPDKEEEIFSTTPSYVYFKESEQEPVGLNNIPLTEMRSLAFDSRIYKTTGLITFVKAVKVSHLDSQERAVKVPFSRFFIAQDTGGAIRGNARSDLYFGYGPQAELTAYNLNDMGEQYFLIKK